VRIRVRHVTTYRYDRPVVLGHHVFRMHPREDSRFALEDFSMAIYPQPAGMRTVRDKEGSLSHEAWFEGEANSLRIAYRWSGRTAPAPQSAPHLAPGGVRLPPSYGAGFGEARTCLQPADAAPDPLLGDFARSIAEEAGGSTWDFLGLLDRRIRGDLSNATRLTGAPMPAGDTLARGGGSCRDLAMLFISACRAQGLAARFVSGYLPAEPGERQHMHAWAEVLLPGAGWVPFDPSQNIAVGERHVAVASAAEPGDAAPISGYFSGPGARCEMDVDLTVETEPV
jgi:transglutaminase-like putative cysteine protease